MADKTTEQTNLSEPERNDLARAIAESDITDGLLKNEDIDALVDLFEAWLERRSTAPTVEQALAELREMFPGKVVFLKDEIEWWAEDATPCRATVIGIDYPPSKGRQFTDDTLAGCVAQVRAWHAEQGKKES